MLFYMPVKLYTGEGCLAEHGEEIAKYGKRFLILTGRSSASRSGALQCLLSALGSFGGEYLLYDRIGANPPVSACAEAGRAGAAFGADAVIGVGGGSPLDAAKAAAVFLANPGIGEDELYSRAWPSEPAPVILVGTTAGTGSEVTSVSVLTDSKGRKHSIRDDAVYASLAFGDPSFTYSMPRALTLSTGIDAVAHCVESWFSKKATDLSRAASASGIWKITGPLSAAAAGKELSPAERSDIYSGSLLGGIAISVTGTCFPHNVGYYLTETRGLPHGLACAVFMEDLLRFELGTCPEYASALFLESGTGFEELSALAAACLAGSAAWEISMTEDEIERALPRWENAGSVKNTVGSPGTGYIGSILKNHFLK